MYLTKKLSDFIKDFDETDEDFVACHYLNEFDGNKESLVRFIIQDKRKPKKKEFSDEKQKTLYYWPGVSPAKMVSVIKTYTKGQRYSEFFHCVYRLRHTEVWKTRSRNSFLNRIERLYDLPKELYENHNLTWIQPEVHRLEANHN